MISHIWYGNQFFFLFLHFGGWKLQWTGKELGLSLVEKLSLRWKDALNYQCPGCLTIPYYKKCKSTSGKHNGKHPSTIFQFVGCVDGPAVKLPLSSLLTCTIVSHTPTFSTPWYTRTLKGQNSPSLLTASRNNSRTVSALLLALHFQNVILRENPSIQPWISIFHRIREWCPSRCQSEFTHPISRQYFGDLILLTFLLFFSVEPVTHRT